MFSHWTLYLSALTMSQKSKKLLLNISTLPFVCKKVKLWAATSECFCLTTGRIFLISRAMPPFSLHVLTHPHSIPLYALSPSMHSRCIMKKANTIIFDFPFALAVHLAHPSLPRPSWLRANEKAVLSAAPSLYPLRIIRREQFWCL